MRNKEQRNRLLELLKTGSNRLTRHRTIGETSENSEIGNDERTTYNTRFTTLTETAKKAGQVGSARYQKDAHTIYLHSYTDPRTLYNFHTVRLEETVSQSEGTMVVREKTYTHDLQNNGMRYDESHHILDANGREIRKSDPTRAEISTESEIVLWLLRRKPWIKEKGLKQNVENNVAPHIVTVRRFNELMSLLNSLTTEDLLAA